jgi:hypothetical protein
VILFLAGWSGAVGFGIQVVGINLILRESHILFCKNMTIKYNYYTIGIERLYLKLK